MALEVPAIQGVACQRLNHRNPRFTTAPPAQAEARLAAEMVGLVAGPVVRVVVAVAERGWMARSVEWVALGQTAPFVSFGALAALSLTMRREVDHGICRI